MSLNVLLALGLQNTSLSALTFSCVMLVSGLVPSPGPFQIEDSYTTMTLSAPGVKAVKAAAAIKALAIAAVAFLCALSFLALLTLLFSRASLPESEDEDDSLLLELVELSATSTVVSTVCGNAFAFAFGLGTLVG